MPNIEDYEAMTKISLSEDEKTIVSGYMNMLLDSFKSWRIRMFQGGAPYKCAGCKSPMRDDVAIKTISREELLSNAPEQHDGYFQVPRTVD